jgi:hypothetical protein
MLAGHRTGSDPMFLHRRWLQKLGIKVQVLNANLCMAYGDAYPTKSPARNAKSRFNMLSCRGCRRWDAAHGQ